MNEFSKNAKLNFRYSERRNNNLGEGGRNFKFITGQLASEVPGVAAGRKLTKQAAYGDLADYVSEKCDNNKKRIIVWVINSL